MADAQLSEDFSDGDITINPTWVSSDESGNGTDFTVAAEELQSLGPSATSTIFISTEAVPSTSGNLIVWEFYARYEQSPSSSNNIEIFVLSNKSNLSSDPQGYFIRLGESGSNDGIDFFKTSSSIPLIEDANPSVATGIDVRIRLSRDDQGNWLLEADPTGGTTYSTIGSVSDTEFIIGPHFGFKVAHTSTRRERFFFDDIEITATNTDVTPPNITMVEVMEPNQLTVFYNESVEDSSATVVTNYSLSNGFGNPASAELVAANEVLLIFSTALTSSDYELAVNNVTDISGNAISSQMVEFSYFIPDTPIFRDVIITEIMADPTPSQGLPEADYIELFNNSTKTFDLSGWFIADANAEVMLPEYILMPNEYIILCSSNSTAEFAPFGNVLGVVSFPNFNNASDDVIVRNESAELIDRVTYDDSWYADNEKSEGGFSLEIINPNDVCGISSNWIASENSSGGTPGQQNSVFNATIGSQLPELEEIRVVSANELTLLFSEELDTLSVEISDFSVDNGIIVESVNINGDEIKIQITQQFATATTYQIIITGLTDCTGNTIIEISESFQYIENPTLDEKDIIISEIMANPNEETALPNAEYIEILNNTEFPLNLIGIQFSDGSTIGELPFYILESSAYIILTDQKDVSLFDGSISVIGLSSFPTLNNDGDAITLKTDNGVILDYVNYSSDWYRSSTKDDGGFALEIIDPSNICSDEENWIASENSDGGTPGVQNSVFSSMPDNIGPQLLNAFGLTQDTIVLVFDEQLDAGSIMNATYELSDNLVIESVLSVDLVTVYLVLSATTPLQSGESYQVSVSNISDCPGNIILTGNDTSFFLVEEAEEGDMIINEILFNPRPNGDDFVEIYNNSQRFISLKNWRLANGDIVNDTLAIDVNRIISESMTIIEPGGYRVITSDALNLANFYPLSAAENFIQISSTPSYPDDEGIVILINESSKVMDVFNYSEEYHSNLINDEEGVSLERISFDEPSDNSENWFSAASNVGFATPGYENSQRQRSTIISNDAIAIEPKIVVPDGDGQNDFTTITYQFDQSGYVGSVSIYDIRGRLVRQIASNDFFSTSGFYIWDGSNDDGQPAKIGYYLVYFEVFTPNGETKEFKQKVVVGSRF